jgi:DNA topoisomerase-3
VEVTIAGEVFRSKGLMITERNFLDIYPYWKWSDKTIPHFKLNETLVPTELYMREV